MPVDLEQLTTDAEREHGVTEDAVERRYERALELISAGMDPDKLVPEWVYSTENWEDKLAEYQSSGDTGDGSNYNDNHSDDGGIGSATIAVAAAIGLAIIVLGGGR